MDPLVLATLPSQDRSAVVRFLDRLALEPGELDCWPALRQVVELLAVLSLVEDMDAELGREARFEAAADVLDISAAAVLRRFYRIHEAASRRFVRPDEGAA